MMMAETAQKRQKKQNNEKLKYRNVKMEAALWNHSLITKDYAFFFTCTQFSQVLPHP